MAGNCVASGHQRSKEAPDPAPNVYTQAAWRCAAAPQQILKLEGGGMRFLRCKHEVHGLQPSNYFQILFFGPPEDRFFPTSTWPSTVQRYKSVNLLCCGKMSCNPAAVFQSLMLEPSILQVVSFRGASREPQGLWASHTAQRTERARSTLLLCCSSAVRVLIQTRHGLKLQYTAPWT